MLVLVVTELTNCFQTFSVYLDTSSLLVSSIVVLLGIQETKFHHCFNAAVNKGLCVRFAKNQNCVT